MTRVPALAVAALILATAAAAEEWTRARIARLPDAAFAVVEIAADGRNTRHLPHHDETGALDVAHVRAARGRLAQVKWLDPAHATLARRHLEEHWREICLRHIDEHLVRRHPQTGE